MIWSYKNYRKLKFNLFLPFDWFPSTISEGGDKKKKVERVKEETHHHEQRRRRSSLRERRRVKEKSKAWASIAWSDLATLLQLITLLRTSIFPENELHRKRKRETKEKHLLTHTETETHVSLPFSFFFFFDKTSSFLCVKRLRGKKPKLMTKISQRMSMKNPRRLQRVWLWNKLFLCVTVLFSLSLLSLVAFYFTPKQCFYLSY